MESKNDGGPAFPKPCDECSHKAGMEDRNDCDAMQSGMSLRDYFAAKALQGVIAKDFVYRKPDTTMDFAMYAKISHLFADAMLKERV